MTTETVIPRPDVWPDADPWVDQRTEDPDESEKWKRKGDDPPEKDPEPSSERPGERRR